jgi:chromosome segregation ATPase
MMPGPLQDRLRDVAARLGDGVRECWRIACQGNELQDAYQQLDVPSVQAELKQLEDEKRASRSDHDHTASIDRAIAAVRSQLSSAKRISDVATDAIDRLRVLNAQLDEAVARAVELSVHADSVGDVAPLGADVDSLVSELESLRQGLEETGGAATGATAPQ